MYEILKMIYLLFLFLNIGYTFAFQGLTKYHNTWYKDSWKTKTVKHIPEYDSELQTVQDILSKKSPIVFSLECENLKKDLAGAGYGKNFIIMGGDCAEQFDSCHVDNVKDYYKLILQMGIISTFITGKKSIKVGRIAGQYAKPRSEPYEIIEGRKYPSYFGDIINSHKINERRIDPKRMIKAYNLSVQTLNILRAFSSGGYAGLDNIKNWFLYDDIYKKFERILNNINKSLCFMKGLGLNNENILSQTDFYISHECLLLPYEQEFVREDSISKKNYACSCHFLWIGERTNFKNSSHVEFLRGVHNPIGLKVSKNTNYKDLIESIRILNPENEMGKISLICRFGHLKIKNELPKLIKIIKDKKLNVVWICDPMHGNTFSIGNKKTRSLLHIKSEISDFFEIHNNCGTIAAGIHLEMTHKNVTECIDHDDNNLNTNYESLCDPRLNGKQSLDIVFSIANNFL